MPKNVYKKDEIEWLRINYPDKPREYILEYFGNNRTWDNIQQLCSKHKIKRNRSNPRIENPYDIVGNKYGRLYVKEYIGVDKAFKRHKYLCDCDCGNKNVEAERHGLITNTKQSCGCLHRETIIALNKKGRIGWYNRHLNKIYLTYVQSARSRNYEFELTKEEFAKLISEPCYYCGCEPSNIHTDKNYEDFAYNGIDRVDNSIGYISSNVVPCCIRCNRAKKDMSVKEFYSWIMNVANNKKIVNGEYK